MSRVHASRHPFVHHEMYSLLIILLNGSFEGLWVGSNDLGDLLSVLEQQKGRHGADTELLCYVWHVIDIELVESGVGEFVGEPVVCVSMPQSSIGCLECTHLTT